MKKDELKKYLATRRMGWPYEDSYHVDNMGGHRFVAKIGDELAGLSYAEVSDNGKEAVMKMNLKGQYAEYGIGTELLELLMEDLQNSGLETIRYEIPRERYAFQIYRNLGFTVERQDEETVRFIWRRTILVTAFEPFGGETLNPTAEVLGMLPDESSGYAIRKLLLPVEYGRSAEIAISEYDRLQPAAVIMLGQAGGRSAISPETSAKNLMDCEAPDNAGYIADHERISEKGPDTLSSTLPVGKIVDVLAARDIPCEISDDAGTYVCNSLFYSMLDHNRGDVPTGFIHVPYIKEQGHTDKPFMEISDICMAIEVIIETISANGEIR
ncbi:MAG: GNAT family N-acetyltransferase [Mogibacterium sp.]|nr:GNAT family N-acetyltransferase [Mogibacterium sp.]